MMYRERDLAVVAAAALGAGYLLGASLPDPPPAAASSGLTIVERLQLPPPPHKTQERWGDVWAIALPLTTPLMIETPSPWDKDNDQQQPDAVPAERALLQQQQPPRDGCYPGRRENFYYRGVLHWRCRYGH